jgi:HAE1 family hydrophobic/amphiphilic exporter-1
VLVKMDRELAARLGITPEDVMQNLVSATNSSVGFDPAFWIDKSKGNHYFIGVQYREELLKDIDILMDIPVAVRDGVPIRLGNVAEIVHEKSPGSVSHRNITRVTDVYANVLPGYDVGTIVDQIDAKIAKHPELGGSAETDNRGDILRLGKLRSGVLIDPTKEKHAFAGYAIRAQGEVKAMRQAFGQFTAGLVIATILVYLVMVAQFRSFIDPFVIILTVPLGFIGVAAMMLLTGTNLSIMSFMGIVMMVGIVVEYSIVLVDFANHRVAEGLSVREAIVDAAKVRARPILMTSLTTWLALLPMAIGVGGGGANVPLARTIIGGVVAATVLSLIVVPCLYAIMKRPPSKNTAELLVT